MSASKVSARLNEATAPEVMVGISAARVAELPAVFAPLSEVNKAHVVMLAEQGLIDRTQAGILARGLLAMEAAGAAAVTLDPAREEAYFNYEAHLIEQIGADAGGRLHIGRSRNDVWATVDRLRARAALLDLVDALLKLRATALSQAEIHASTVMPGYTHLQPAQPITYGFYLGAIAQALARDTQRLLGTLAEMDACPLGAAAFSGTPFAIDRMRTAALLGFETYVDNALDAVASRDFILESLAHLSVLAVLWSRIAQDYHIWSTHEFALIEFPDSVAATSSIMPQKKNPLVLEHLKGRCGHIAAALFAALMGTKGTSFSHNGESSRAAISGFWESARDVGQCLSLFDLVLRTARPIENNARRQAAEDFSTMTALADLMVREHDISFRAAHHIVGAVVRAALDGGITADQIEPGMIEAAAIEQLGRPIRIDAETLRRQLDPAANVAARRSAGGPGLAALQPSIAKARNRLAEDRLRAEAWREGIADAHRMLAAAIEAIASEA